MTSATRIPWNTPRSWVRVNRRLSAALALAGPRLADVRPEAADLLSRMTILARDQQRLAETTCPRCPEPCCRVATIWFDRQDLVFFHLAGLAAPPGQPRPDPDRPCRYLGHRGCRLPRLRRPWICTRYLCPTQRLRLNREPGPDGLRDMGTTVKVLTQRRRHLATAITQLIGTAWEGFEDVVR